TAASNVVTAFATTTPAATTRACVSSVSHGMIAPQLEGSFSSGGRGGVSFSSLPSLPSDFVVSRSRAEDDNVQEEELAKEPKMEAYLASLVDAAAQTARATPTNEVRTPCRGSLPALTGPPRLQEGLGRCIGKGRLSLLGFVHLLETIPLLSNHR